MNSELIVMTFSHPDEAKTVLEAIRAMRKSPVLSLDSVVVAVKNRNGESTYRLVQQRADENEDRDARILLSLADLMLRAQPDDATETQMVSGMDSHFIMEIARIMEDESSALFFLARENSIHDADEMRRTLALFKGRIHQTSLSPEIEARLLASSHGQHVLPHEGELPG